MYCPTSRCEVGAIGGLYHVEISTTSKIGVAPEGAVGENSILPAKEVAISATGSKLTRDRVPKIKIALRPKLGPTTRSGNKVTNSLIRDLPIYIKASTILSERRPRACIWIVLKVTKGGSTVLECDPTIIDSHTVRSTCDKSYTIVAVEPKVGVSIITVIDIVGYIQVDT